MIGKLTQRRLVIPLVALVVMAGAAVSQVTATSGTALLTGLLIALGLMPDGGSNCGR